MDEQAMLHRLSVECNVDIELLRNLFHNDELLALIKAGKSMDAAVFICSIKSTMVLREARIILQAFSAELK